MPNDSTPVPHYQQASPGTGLLACVRMVAATFGHELTEQEIGQVMGSYGFGTPAGHLSRLRRFGYRVEQGNMDLFRLQEALDRRQKPILFVAAEQLPWADFSGLHPLVLTEMTVKALQVLDPAQATGPTELSRQDFLRSWQPYHQLAAILSG